MAILLYVCMKCQCTFPLPSHAVPGQRITCTRTLCDGDCRPMADDPRSWLYSTKATDTEGDAIDRGVLQGVTVEEARSLLTERLQEVLGGEPFGNLEEIRLVPQIPARGLWQDDPSAAILEIDVCWNAPEPEFAS